MNHKLVTKATRGPRCTTSLFISSYFSAWSATNQLATSLIRSRRWNYNAQFVGYWPRGNGACGKPDTYQSADGILGRIRDPTNLRPPPPLPPLSLSLFVHSIGIRPLSLFLSLSIQCIPLERIPLSQVSTMTRWSLAYRV